MLTDRWPEQEKKIKKKEKKKNKISKNNRSAFACRSIYEMMKFCDTASEQINKSDAASNHFTVSKDIFSGAPIFVCKGTNEKNLLLAKFCSS